jgi:predicted regulator of Ras-like GTPase activity (Roadblock/LC7/MglB family)
MAGFDLIIEEEDYGKICFLLQALQEKSNAKVVYLVDKNGQNIASAGDDQSIDKTSFASLVAGNVAATGGLAELLGEEEFSILFHEGKRDSIHISIIINRIILVVIFGEETNLGLVRLWVKKAVIDLGRIFGEIASKDGHHKFLSDSDELSDSTDQKIDSLKKK